MRTVYVTGGYADTLEVDATAVADLSAATFKLALVADGDTRTPPAVGSNVWQTATVAAGDGLATVLKRSVNDSTPPGRYSVWLQVTFGGITVPVLVYDDAGHPWVVLVV